MIVKILLFSFLFNWYHKIVPPKNGDTRGEPHLNSPYSNANTQYELELRV